MLELNRVWNSLSCSRSIKRDAYLRFIPVDAFDTDYDLKILRNTFTSAAGGIGSTSIGLIDVLSATGVSTAGVTTTIASFDATEFESLYANVEIVNNVLGTDEINFVELYVTTDGTNTFLSEYFRLRKQYAFLQ